MTWHIANDNLILYTYQNKKANIKNMKTTKVHALTRLLSIATIFAVLLLQVFPIDMASAAQITTRKLELRNGATDGGSMAGGTVDHFFSFTLPGGSNVGSIEFKYCTAAAGVPNPNDCTMPTDLLTTNATLGSESGATGFSINSTTNGTPYLTRTAANVPANTPVTYRLDDIDNPSTIGTFYVRISTWAESTPGTTQVDTGVVAASTAEQIDLSGIMPESLVFCVGATVSKTGGVPDCTTATAGDVSFNQLFSPTATASATSQMAASTNAGTGYVISVNGPTLTSGANTIDAMTAQGASVLGTSQFGMNLMLNTTPAVGAEVDPVSDATDWKGQATTGYEIADQYKFNTGDTVADSANGGAGATNAQIFTSSYIVNVEGKQAAGTYVSTLTYICTATY